MKTYNADNERIKHQYFTYLKEARRASEQSVDEVAKALHRFETYTGFRGFKRFRVQQAVGFKADLASQTSVRTGERLSKATSYSTLAALRRFFQWLSGRPGYRSHFSVSDADYFSASDRDTRIAKAVRERPAPTVEQIVQVIGAMPGNTEIERRDRALLAFTLLTGVRDGALRTLRLKHVDLNEGMVIQDAREVHTKFGKSFNSYFFPVGEAVRGVVEEWVAYLRGVKGWGDDDPLFPATFVQPGVEQQFEAIGLDRRHWATADPIRGIFRQAFERSGLPYFNPHSFRKTLTLLGLQSCRSAEDFKAYSQNFGHEKVLTTFLNYGTVTRERQAEIIRHLGGPQARRGMVELAQEMLRVAQTDK